MLADDFNRVTMRLRDYVIYITEISEKLHEIATGNLAFTLENEYTGEFKRIKAALDEISHSLNNAMGQLRAASRDVAAGAEQVSAGATTLSQGSTEQAAEVETLAEHINAVSDSVHKIALGAQKASAISQNVKTGILASNDKMQNMTLVIQRISDKSTEINKIVRTIEDIAFQTNILALNAAVEASRAGDAGKGFSAVSDEVRSLASKSSEAAKSTGELIGRSIHDVKTGTESTGLAISAVQVINECIQSLKELMDEIAHASAQQSEMIVSVENRIKEVSRVVETNSFAADESAVISNELTNQAKTLNRLISQFRIQ